MTIDEAIKVLRTESIELGGSAPSVCRFWEALDMAISALRQQDVADKDVGNNEPLTLDELRKMDGEPVWVVCLKPERYYEPPIGWRIIEKSVVGTFDVWNDSSCLAERDYGKTWLAYRQKPEEGTV